MGGSAGKDDDLYTAISQGDFSRFCLLISRKSPTETLSLSPNADSESAPTVLHLLCRFSRLSMLTTLFSLHPHIPVDIADDFGNTPLIIAVKARNNALVTMLLQHGADPNCSNIFDSSDSPLHFAAFLGDRETAKVLIDAGGNFNAQNDRGMTPVMYAAQKGHKDLCELLIASGADLTLADVRGLRLRDYAKTTGMEFRDEKGSLWDLLSAEERGEHHLQSTVLESSVSERIFTDPPADFPKQRWFSCFSESE